jgi:hypothetical protein
MLNTVQCNPQTNTSHTNESSINQTSSLSKPSFRVDFAFNDETWHRANINLLSTSTCFCLLFKQTNHQSIKDSSLSKTSFNVDFDFTNDEIWHRANIHLSYLVLLFTQTNHQSIKALSLSNRHSMLISISIRMKHDIEWTSTFHILFYFPSLHRLYSKPFKRINIKNWRRWLRKEQMCIGYIQLEENAGERKR